MNMGVCGGLTRFLWNHIDAPFAVHLDSEVLPRGWKLASHELHGFFLVAQASFELSILHR